MCECAVSLRVRRAGKGKAGGAAGVLMGGGMEGKGLLACLLPEVVGAVGSEVYGARYNVWK